MSCKHESVDVGTREVVYQRYHRNAEDWGKTISQEVEELLEISCADCDADLTDELGDEIRKATRGRRNHG